MNAVAVPRTEVRILKVKRATAEALKPYGEVLGFDPNTPPLPIDFYDGKAQVRRVVNFVSDGQTEMPVVTLQRRPLEVRWMERHFKHTQAFISLGSKPFVAVFAPPNSSDTPDLDKVEAFLFDGQAGFVMHVGTWHELPFAVLDDTNLVVILRKEATEGLIRDNVIQDEALGPDLDKKDLQARFGITFRIEV